MKMDDVRKWMRKYGDAYLFATTGAMFGGLGYAFYETRHVGLAIYSLILGVGLGASGIYAYREIKRRHEL